MYSPQYQNTASPTNEANSNDSSSASPRKKNDLGQKYRYEMSPDVNYTQKLIQKNRFATK